MNLDDIVKSAYQFQIENISRKYEYALDIYLKRNDDLYSKKEVQTILQCQNALLFKFALTTIFLEFLWKRSEANRQEISFSIENSIFKHEWQDSEKILGSAFLEGFLFEARSFLDIFERFCCLILKYTRPNQKGTDGFYKILDNKIDNIFKEKATKIKDIFRDEVFADNKWGKLLKDLRDKIAHFDILNYNYEGDEFIYGTLLDWPTIHKKTYERFLQEKILNELFMFMSSMTSILFDIDWIAGTLEEFKTKVKL